MLLGMKKMEDCNQQILQQSFLFQGLSKEEFQELLVYFPSPEVFAKGEIIYSRSHFRKAIGIILCGAAQVTCGNGTSQILVKMCIRDRYPSLRSSKLEKHKGYNFLRYFNNE